MSSESSSEKLKRLTLEREKALERLTELEHRQIELEAKVRQRQERN